MRACDYIIDIGPEAGVHGGQVIAAGTYDEIYRHPTSETALYLSGRKHITRDKYMSKFDEFMSIKNARENNLKGIDVDIPSTGLTMITGVSGSGKSSLIMDTLAKFSENHFARTPKEYGACDAVYGIDAFDKAIIIDQSPIGKTPHSNIATYTGVFTLIREVFAASLEAQKR
jgi:excinuclease ABC subunit A